MSDFKFGDKVLAWTLSEKDSGVNATAVCWHTPGVAGVVIRREVVFLVSYLEIPSHIMPGAAAVELPNDWFGSQLRAHPSILDYLCQKHGADYDVMAEKIVSFPKLSELLPVVGAVSSPSVMRRNPQTDGCACSECGTFAYMAAPNMEDGTFKCYSCRQDPYRMSISRH